MATTISSQVLNHQREKLTVKLATGDAAEYDVPHNFGVVPIDVQISPIGDGATAVITAVTSQKVTVKLSSGAGAYLQIWNGGA